MTTRTAEKRRNMRSSAAYPITIRDNRGYILAAGRTANISENGVFMISRGCAIANPPAKLIAQIKLPSLAGDNNIRIVRYLCKVVRRHPIGPLMGLGIEFLEKLE